MTTTTPTTAEASPPVKVGHTPPNERLQSIDALRGFDMFWISGGEYLFHALALTTGWTWAIFISRQLIHSRDLGHWSGFTFFDLIQPLFPFWQMLATIAVEFLFLLWLYRRKIFWRV